MHCTATKNLVVRQPSHYSSSGMVSARDKAGQTLSLVVVLLLLLSACSSGGSDESIDDNAETPILEDQSNTPADTGLQTADTENTETNTSAENTDIELGPALPTNVKGNEEPQAIDLSDDILVPPPAPVLNIDAGMGELVFSWSPVTAESLVSIEQFDRRTRESIVIASDLDSTTNQFSLSVSPHQFAWRDSEFILSVCAANDCLRSFNTPVAELQNLSVTRLTAPSGEMFDRFGTSLSSAAAGRILVVGAPGTDIPTENDNNGVSNTELATGADAGSAELLFEVDNIWWQGATLVSRTPSFNARLGEAVATSGNGDTVVIGAPGDARFGDTSGAAFVFERTGETWVQVAELAPGFSRDFARFGAQVAISEDARVIAVAAPGDSNVTGDPFSQTQSDERSGSVTLYRFDGSTNRWLLSDYLQPADDDGRNVSENFGEAIDLSTDGTVLAVAAPGDIRDDIERGTDIGSVYIFDQSNGPGQLMQQLGGESLDSTASDHCGNQQIPAVQSIFSANLALSNDGDVLVIECLTRPDIDINRNDIAEKPQARVHVFERNADGVFIATAELTPAGVHGVNSELTVAVSAETGIIAAALLNPDSDTNTLTLFNRFSDASVADVEIWNTLNVFEQPDPGILNFGTSLQFSSGGEVLFVGADSSGAVFLY